MKPWSVREGDKETNRVFFTEAVKLLGKSNPHIMLFPGEEMCDAEMLRTKIPEATLIGVEREKRCFYENPSQSI